MNVKRFTISFIVVFIIGEFTNYLIHGVILASTYSDPQFASVFRSEGAMMSMMWIMYVVDIIWSFFFVFLFVKGYENKGVMEGIRFGIYMGLFVNLVAAYAQYVVYQITYPLALQWFIYGFIQSIILGITASLIYKPKPEMKAAA